jgi:hypothetical protein
MFTATLCIFGIPALAFVVFERVNCWLWCQREAARARRERLRRRLGLPTK